MSQLKYDIAKFLLENKKEILEGKKYYIKNLIDRKAFYKGPNVFYFKEDLKSLIKHLVKPIVLMHFHLTTEDYYVIMQSDELNNILEEYYESTNSL